MLTHLRHWIGTHRHGFDPPSSSLGVIKKSTLPTIARSAAVNVRPKGRHPALAIDKIKEVMVRRAT
ncbi:MAG: hypothetical protein IH627_19190 [Rubrivivax sp.]|nr:hypothetical protein [Rubrivivax sp.]